MAKEPMKVVPVKATPTPTPTPTVTPKPTPTPSPTITLSKGAQEKLNIFNGSGPGGRNNSVSSTTPGKYKVGANDVIIGWRQTGRPGGVQSWVPNAINADKAKQQFQSGLYENNQNAWDVAGKLYSMGLTKGAPGTTRFLDSVVSAYNKLVDIGTGNKTQSILDIASIRAGSGPVDGSGPSSGNGVGGKSVYKSYQKYTTDQAKKVIQDAYELYLGRDATSKEISDGVTALTRAAKAAPTIQTTKTGKGGATSQDVTQGFNEASWITGYISARVGLDQIDEVAGKVGSFNDDLERLQENWGYRPSKKLRLDSTRDLLEGKTTIEDVAGLFKEQAKILFPALSDAINQGLTVRQIADTKIAAKARILEQPEEKLNLFDPDITAALSRKNEKGEYVSMTDDEFAQSLRSKPGWLKTKNAKETMRSAADDILKEFGFRG
jgi:hypothetical protein